MDADSTPNVEVPIDFADANITIEFTEVDPLVDAYMRHAGRTSKRRMMNIFRRRHRKMLEENGVTSEQDIRVLTRRATFANYKEYVTLQLQPTYSMYRKED